MENQDLLEALDFIDPGSLTYEEYVEAETDDGCDWNESEE